MATGDRLILQTGKLRPRQVRSQSGVTEGVGAQRVEENSAPLTPRDGQQSLPGASEAMGQVPPDADTTGQAAAH